MKKIKLIGLTGGVATGKSTVARMFKKLHITVIDTDELSHEVIKKKRREFKEILRICGSGILDKNGEIDRSKLADKTFSGSGKAVKIKVEKIIHSSVWKRVKELTQKLEKKGEEMVVIEIPLLFEAKWDKKVDTSVVVICDQKEQERRCPPRFRRRIKFQLSINDKAQLADFVIDNSGSRRKTAEQVRALVRVFSGG